VWGPYYKQDEKTLMENSYNTLPAYLRHNVGGLHYIKELKRHYESLTVKPDYKEKYVVLFLHYQPEATTCPIGNIFVDQELCVDMLLKHLPEEYNVYIKEHPSQFYANSEGQLGRIKETYYDLVKKPRVRLMSTSEVSFDLIEHSEAVATVSGTVGWESIVRGKPTIIFGMTWYENYDKGCLRVTDDASASRMMSFINNYSYDENALRAYLASVSQNTIKAYFYKAVHKDKMLVSEAECIDNLSTAIMSQVVKRH
jgi:capsule polysaccharide export protein KpsC/LpsZ